MRTVFLLIVLLLVAGCGQPTPAPTLGASVQAAQIALTINPQPPVVGTATLTVTVTRQSQPLVGVAVAVRGDMTHAGMAPVIANAKTDAQGKIDIPFKWSMSGDWIVTVTVTLADQSEVSQDFNITVKP